ncbi:MAG TPA: tellurite resistance/C4-dicarboxylate transporter family protein [Polyangia bacterium]|nr:tellurite resistance/C4-dicarboxylate transporter family protein [Polyangia bacterium]
MLAEMHPAYFALVMATGIVSLAAQLLGHRAVAVALFALNLVFYAVLVVCAVLRVVRHRDRVVADLFHHGRSFGFFTAVAATEVIGSQLLLVTAWHRAALAAWAVGIVLWLVLTYTIFTVITVKSEKPSLADGINGAWLLIVVAAQSVAVLGAQLAPGMSAAELVLFFCLVVWLGGVMLYIWIIALIFYRYSFFPLNPSDLSPPYWINMGAAAISTLAGAMLVAAAGRSPVVTAVLPFVRGLTLLWWATASWWIPMLLILGLWRHVYRRFPLKYDPLYWGAVFPLGMYAVCTARLARAVEAPFLIDLARGFMWVAFVAWLAAAVGLAARLARRRAA